MLYKTFVQIRTKILMEYDLENEELVQAEEFKGYVNDGVDEAETEIHKLGLEDEYFLSKSFLPLVSGASDIDLPTDIYANKIRKIIYKSGATIYPINRIRGKDRFEEREVENSFGSGTFFYNYLIYNPDPASKPKIDLIPPSREDSATNVVIWYIRNANNWDTVDTANCDLPECAMQFLYSYIHWRLSVKERSPEQSARRQEMIEQKKIMVETLSGMVDDGDSTVEQDLSHYDEQQ